MPPLSSTTGGASSKLSAASFCIGDLERHLHDTFAAALKPNDRYVYLNRGAIDNVSNKVMSNIFYVYTVVRYHVVSPIL